MKKFRNVPAFVTLLAGLVCSIVMILQKYTLVKFLWVLIGIMLTFYIAGLLIRMLLNKAFKDLEEQKKNSEEDADSENQENSTEADSNSETKEEGDNGNSQK